eukprot:SAG22_NODE_245_length_13962_cov_11.954555_3_plen_42_part_00
MVDNLRCLPRRRLRPQPLCCPAINMGSNSSHQNLMWGAEAL